MLIIIYAILGYWSTGMTIYANKVIIGDGFAFFINRLVVGFLFGWVLIPWALIKLFFFGG